MIKLFLDDIRVPTDCIGYVHRFGIRPDTYLADWVIVRNYEQFVSYIEKNGLPSLISFDHDLADEHYNDAMYEGLENYNEAIKDCKEKTGYDCAVWLINYCMDNNLALPAFHTHSMNPIGRIKIQSVLEQFQKTQTQG